MRVALTSCFLATVACGEGSDIRIGRDVHVDCGVQELHAQLAEADLLLVVDGSGSMGAPVSELQLNVGRLIQTGVDSGLDYHLGVTNTDEGAEQGHLRSCGTDPLWVTPELDTPAQTAMVQCTLANLNTPISEAAEVPAAAALSALGPTLATGPHAGFARNGARLTVVMMTDEVDQSPGSVTELVQSFEAIEPEGGLEVITVAGQATDSCAAFNSSGWDLTTQLGGQFLSVCGSMASSVDVIAETAFALADTFPLDGSPDPEALVVEICAGESIDCQRTNAWTLSAGAVVLDAPPRGGEWVRFSYDDC